MIWSGIIGATLSATPTICADQSIVRDVMMISTGFSGCIVLPLIYSALGPLVCVAFAWWFAGRCQHRRLTFTVGFAFGAGSILGWIAAILLTRPSGVPPNQILFRVGAVILIASIVGAIFGLANLAINWLFRQIRYVIAEQDGTLCWQCAYVVGNPPISGQCSECGAPIHPPTARTDRNRFVIACKRHAQIIAIGLLALFAVGIVPRMWLESSGIARLARQFGQNTPTAGWTMVQVGSSYGTQTWTQTWEASGVWITAPGDATKAIVIAYAPSPAPQQPVMQLQLMGLTTGYPMFGNPAITCDLSAVQAEYVFAHGLPPSMTDALLDAANKANWAPMPRGGLVNCVDVSADGHFPAEANP